jgi:S-adenosylmethionine:tRNA ribosyltransferase-isomerase
MRSDGGRAARDIAMRTELFDYDLPPELIAQSPGPRGDSRLLVLHRDSGAIEHRMFRDLPEYIVSGDSLVLNVTRVTARRLTAMRESGLPAELLLMRPVGETGWEALVRPGRGTKPGRRLAIQDGSRCVSGLIAGVTEDGGRTILFEDRETRDRLASQGEIPLPPYIHEPLPADKEERYQTVYAASPGSAAAPTAGLHFTPELMAQVEARGATFVKLTLHVGVATFRPVRSEEIEAHVMHAERFEIGPEAAQAVNETRSRVVAVGTTSVRALETAALGAEALQRVAAMGEGESRLFITPGYRFRAVDALITNFHLPRSTLLMLVSAFAGVESVRRAYAEAVLLGYRFFSFGDAMLIL